MLLSLGLRTIHHLRPTLARDSGAVLSMDRDTRHPTHLRTEPPTANIHCEHPLLASALTSLGPYQLSFRCNLRHHDGNGLDQPFILVLLRTVPVLATPRPSDNVATRRAEAPSTSHTSPAHGQGQQLSYHPPRRPRFPQSQHVAARATNLCPQAPDCRARCLHLADTHLHICAIPCHRRLSAASLCHGTSQRTSVSRPSERSQRRTIPTTLPLDIQIIPRNCPSVRPSVRPPRSSYIRVGKTSCIVFFPIDLFNSFVAARDSARLNVLAIQVVHRFWAFDCVNQNRYN
ncbi:hypothetical protein C8R47DRAFT_333932 [Mycena vitilis]|nr:hypothetical protein C8R47DRAFT_333932 [Mycena vitilis]